MTMYIWKEAKQMDKIKRFLTGERFRELFVYGVAGVFTTLVNYISYVAVTRGVAALTAVEADNAALILAASIIAWALSVIFAFWANKRFVFRSASGQGHAEARAAGLHHRKSAVLGL